MKILITGGRGFLGVHLVEELLKEGHELRLLMRTFEPHPYLDSLKVERFLGTISDPTILETAMQGMQAVFHLAGVVSYDPAKTELMERTNVVGTRLVGEAALKAGVERMVYTSSTAAIGINYNQIETMNEETKFNARPLNMAYFNTKYDAEQQLRELGKKGLDYVIVNPGSIIGPRDTRKKAQVYVGLIKRFNPRFLPPGGNNFVGIEEVVRGHILAWKKGRSGERYILSGENLTFGELIQKTNRILGRKEPCVKLPVFAMDIVSIALKVAQLMGKEMRITPELVKRIGSWYLFVDSSKAERELGYQVKPIDDAIECTLDWLRAENLISK